jgi:hypothetical protein
VYIKNTPGSYTQTVEDKASDVSQSSKDTAASYVKDAGDTPDIAEGPAVDKRSRSLGRSSSKYFFKNHT